MEKKNISELKRKIYEILLEYNADLDESQMDDFYLSTDKNGVNSLDMTSIELIEFIVNLEDIFEIEIEVDEFRNNQKVADVIDCIYNKIK